MMFPVDIDPFDEEEDFDPEEIARLPWERQFEISCENARRWDAEAEHRWEPKYPPAFGPKPMRAHQLLWLAEELGLTDDGD